MRMRLVREYQRKSRKIHPPLLRPRWSAACHRFDVHHAQRLRRSYLRRQDARPKALRRVLLELQHVVVNDGPFRTSLDGALAIDFQLMILEGSTYRSLSRVSASRAYALMEGGRLALVHVGRAGRPPSQILYLKVYSGARFAAAGRLWGSVGLSGNVPRIATAVRTSACCSAWRAEVAKAASARAYESRSRSARKELAPASHE